MGTSPLFPGGNPLVHIIGTDIPIKPILGPGKGFPVKGRPNHPLAALPVTEAAVNTIRATGCLFSVGDEATGNGVLVGNGWLLTAKHVLPVADIALNFRVRLGYSSDAALGFDFELDPAVGYVASEDGLDGMDGLSYMLDYALVKIKPVAGDGVTNLASFGSASVSNVELQHGVPVLLPQHRGKQPLTMTTSVSVETPNAGNVEDVRDGLLFHLQSTVPGSSGAPIMDAASGEVVGVHTHTANPVSPDPLYAMANWGATMKMIIDDLTGRGKLRSPWSPGLLLGNCLG